MNIECSLTMRLVYKDKITSILTLENVSILNTREEIEKIIYDHLSRIENPFEEGVTPIVLKMTINGSENFEQEKRLIDYNINPFENVMSFVFLTGCIIKK